MRRAVLVVVGGVLAAAFLGTIAYALTIERPSDGSIIYACYDKGGKGAGKIRLVNDDTRCRRTEAKLQWRALNTITDFNGTPCVANGNPGTISITFDATGEGSLTCLVPPPPDECESLPDGASCNDENLCTTSDQCASGTCAGGTPVTCDDGNECTLDSCDPGTGCASVAEPDGAPCTDGTCQGGMCVASGTCTPGEPCTISNPHGTCTGNTSCDTSGNATCDARVPSAETCDAQDNDCNGVIDEGFNVGDSCSEGIGACEASGTIVCDPSGDGSSCDATAGAPSDEVCDNGIDDDCDGAADGADSDCP